jgi:hypothetical protein
MNIRNNLLVLVAALAICGATAASHATTNIVSTEIGIEASTDMTTLPLTNTGAIVLSCGSCRTPRSYHVTPQTTYFVGTATVTLAQLNAFVISGGTRGMTIFVKPDESAVTRIVVFGQLNSPKSH